MFEIDSFDRLFYLIMGYINVKNKKGTSNNPIPAGYTSWLDYWESKKSKKATICEVRYCNKSPDVGGHVIKAGQGPKEYILPLCTSHNNMGENEIFQDWESDLIPVSDI